MSSGRLYEKLFRAPVSFARRCAKLVFERNDMIVTLPGSCPELAQMNDHIAIDYLARLDKNDVVAGVTRKIIDLLPDGDCDRDKVASAPCMSPSTLQLKLQQHGTSFQHLFDGTRKELSCSYLRQPTRSVTEITFMLGFATTSSFTRAFKRRTGKSPTEFRGQA